MFSQKRNKKKTPIYIVLAILIIVLAFLIYLMQKPDIPKEVEKVNNQVTTEEFNEEKPNQESYYWIKNDNNIVKIYFSNENGEMTEIEETQIVYETLPPEDQQKFDKGIKVNNLESLNELMMNYES